MLLVQEPIKKQTLAISYDKNFTCSPQREVLFMMML
jgi:hypothetical protein